MNTLVTLALLFSFPVTPITTAPKKPVVDAAQTQNQAARKNGRWLMAANGHAVFCFGPIVMMPDVDGGFQRVATFCQGEKPMVELHD